MRAYGWPGNVRELRNVVQRVWVMTSGDAIDEEWLPQPLVAPPPVASPAPPQDAAAPVAEGMLHIALGTRLSEIERQVILATYAHCDHHKERTAATLGISMKTLYNRLKEYGD
jgi:two-component system response regulator AtoC